MFTRKKSKSALFRQKYPKLYLIYIFTHYIRYLRKLMMRSLKPLVGADCHPPLHYFWRCLFSRLEKVIHDINAQYLYNIHVFSVLFITSLNLVVLFSKRGEWFHNTGEIGERNDLDADNLCIQQFDSPFG
jgi:hypothetical protein